MNFFNFLPPSEPFIGEISNRGFMKEEITEELKNKQVFLIENLL